MGEQVGARSKKEEQGNLMSDEIDAGFTSDLREKAIFLSDG